MAQDISEQFKDCVKAEQDGKNVLILRKLDFPVKRNDGKKAIYELEYRWLSNPDYVSCVQGSDYTYWQAKEVQLKKGLFEQFNLY